MILYYRIGNVLFCRLNYQLPHSTFHIGNGNSRRATTILIYSMTHFADRFSDYKLNDDALAASLEINLQCHH